MSQIIGDFDAGHKTCIEYQEIQFTILGQYSRHIGNFHFRRAVGSECFGHQGIFHRPPQLLFRAAHGRPGHIPAFRPAAHSLYIQVRGHPPFAVRPQHQSVRFRRILLHGSIQHALQHFGRSGVFHSVLFDNGFRLSVSFDLVEGSTFARKVDIDKHIALQTVHRTYDLAQVFISEVSPPRE